MRGFATVALFCGVANVLFYAAVLAYAGVYYMLGYPAWW
jgi:hypothetical protein